MNSTPRCVMLALACITSLSACSSKGAAEAAVRESLKDPDSAKFGDLYFNDKTKKGCLTVNARNSMGGYTGDQQAYVEKTDKGWEVLGIGNIPLSICQEVHADRPPETDGGSDNTSAEAR